MSLSTGLKPRLAVVALAFALSAVPLAAQAQRGGGWHGGGGWRGGWGGGYGCCGVGVWVGPGYYPPAYYPPAYYPPPVVYAPPYYPPPAYYPPPPAPPAPLAQQNGLFRVYFNFDRATLTPEAARVVAAAADTYRRSGAPRVEVVGYTDLAGSASYNLVLSRHRADIVRAALVHAGVPASAIAVNWHGKQDPAVPTRNGAREAQNRRVLIIVGAGPTS